MKRLALTAFAVTLLGLSALAAVPAAADHHEHHGVRFHRGFPVRDSLYVSSWEVGNAAFWTQTRPHWGPHDYWMHREGFHWGGPMSHHYLHHHMDGMHHHNGTHHHHNGKHRMPPDRMDKK